MKGIWISGGEARDAVLDIYHKLRSTGLVELSVDNIPYTEDFERVYLRVQSGYPLTRNETFRYLMNRRKGSDERTRKCN